MSTAHACHGAWVSANSQSRGSSTCGAQQSELMAGTVTCWAILQTLPLFFSHSSPTCFKCFFSSNDSGSGRMGSTSALVGAITCSREKKKRPELRVDWRTSAYRQQKPCMGEVTDTTASYATLTYERYVWEQIPWVGWGDRHNSIICYICTYERCICRQELYLHA